MVRRNRNDGERQAKGLKQRHVPFTALLGGVPVTFLGWWALHLVLRGDALRLALAVTLAEMLVGIGLAALAFHIGKGRRPLVRWHIAASVSLAGLGGAITVAVGWRWIWVITYLSFGVLITVSWMLYRLDALRADKGDGDGEDDLKKELGLGKVRFRNAVRHEDADGKLARIEVDVDLKNGETIDTVQGALPSLESVANAVPLRGRVVRGDSADKAHLTLIMQDMMKGKIPWPGPSAPGACITEPIVDGMFEDQQVSQWFLAGNHPDAPNPSSRGIMGMTRTGKTLVAQIDVLEMVTRKRVVIFWFDSIKGAQTVGPLRPAFDIVVADDVESGDPKMFRAGMKAIINLIKDRADRLGRAGYRQWTPEAADALGMPFLYAHLEEADVLCDIAPDELVFIASKGLSAGVGGGISLQRASHESMPTALRFNIGTWDCFGCGDAISVGFALSDSTINAGAHPEEWRQSKPGYHYREGIGIDPQRWPVLRKGYFATDPRMAAHVTEWAPHMDKLGEEDIAALGDWYQQMKEIMRREDLGMLRTNGSPPPTRLNVNRPDDEEEGEGTLEEYKRSARADIESMRESGEIETDPETADIDPDRPIAVDAEAEEITWRNPPEAISKAAADEAFDRALFELAADPDLWDARRGCVVFMVGTLAERYKFRTRPWFSKRLSELKEGKAQVRHPVTRQPVNAYLEDGDKTGQYLFFVQRNDIADAA